MSTTSGSRSVRSSAGYSLIELIITVGIMTVVSGTVMSAVLGMNRMDRSVSNRAEMHAGVRNATELLQQEIGQAGRIAFKADSLVLATSVTAGYNGPVTLTPTPSADGVSGLFQDEFLVVDSGDREETVRVLALNLASNQITASFKNAHSAGARIAVQGGFQAGVVPPSVANGSTGTVLKIFGDIHSNGEMVYIEYSCDFQTGNLYRRSMPFDAGLKDPITPDEALLNNILPNPDGTDCFTYQVQMAAMRPYVTDVAITLTVETPDLDAVTGLLQQETKALLNVSPRNVFNVWQLDNGFMLNRVQPTPQTITTLLPQP